MLILVYAFVYTIFSLVLVLIQKYNIYVDSSSSRQLDNASSMMTFSSILSAKEKERKRERKRSFDNKQLYTVGLFFQYWWRFFALSLTRSNWSSISYLPLTDEMTFLAFLVVVSNSCHSLMINDRVYVYSRVATLDWLDQLNMHHAFSKESKQW